MGEEEGWAEEHTGCSVGGGVGNAYFGLVSLVEFSKHGRGGMGSGYSKVDFI